MLKGDSCYHRRQKPNMDKYVNAGAVLKWILAVSLATWSGMPSVMRTLMFLMIVDYITGLVVAYLNKSISSAVGVRGLLVKGATISLLLLTHYVEQALGTELGLEKIGAIGYAVNECISITENFANIGVPIPQPFVEALLKAKSLKYKPASQAELDKLLDDDGRVRVPRRPDPPSA